MKIINENNEPKLEYKYKIITNRNKRADGTTYYFYTTQLSCEIINYFGTTTFYVYNHENKIYMTTEEPVEYILYKKFKARKKYNHSKIRAMPVNGKLFHLIGDVKDKSLVITLNLTKKDFVSDDILVELNVVKD